MNGEMMLVVSDNDLAEVGVVSRLHQVKIITLFRRLASGEPPTRSIALYLGTSYVSGPCTSGYFGVLKHPQTL